MQKDVIYIDVEDDITSIIGKVKEAKQGIVALVPPKRIGAIQSAVNLKLVHRAAEQADKRLVIISNNSALMALAGSAGIPVAKNLQSKPELAEISALEVDDGEDIIDGSELPSKDADTASSNDSDDEKSDNTAEKKAAAGVGAAAVGSVASVAPKAAAARKAIAEKSPVKVPNFNDTRKKIILGALIALGLIGFIIWAVFFAPSARIIITAKTSDAALNSRVTLGPTLATDLKAGTIKAETKTVKKDVSVAFTATGKKDVGEQATGTVKFTPVSPTIFLNGATIPAGTPVTADGKTFLTNAVVVFDSDASASSLAAGKSVGVVAQSSGSSYNGISGTASGPSGFSTTFTTTTSGGTDKTITVVQQSDIDAVSDQVSKNDQATAAKNELKALFKDAYIILESTFKSDAGDVRPTPAVGQEAADGKGTLAGGVVYSLTAVPKSQVKTYLDTYFAQQIDGRADQKVYDNGLGGVTFTNVSGVENGFGANISTNGKLGPKIDEAKLKEFAKGKKYGEIQSEVEAIEGVESADIKFSPFWVSKAPNDVKRITIEFKVNG